MLRQIAGWIDDYNEIHRDSALRMLCQGSSFGRCDQNSCIRLWLEHPNHLWSYDFVHDRTDNGRSFAEVEIEPPVERADADMESPVRAEP